MSIFQIYDLDIDPMTWILILDLDIIMMYYYTKNEVTAQTDRHTDTPWKYYLYCIRER